MRAYYSYLYILFFSVLDQTSGRNYRQRWWWRHWRSVEPPRTGTQKWELRPADEDATQLTHWIRDMTPSVAKTHKTHILRPSGKQPLHNSRFHIHLLRSAAFEFFMPFTVLIESCETYFWKCGFRSLRSIMNFNWAMWKLKSVKMQWGNSSRKDYNANDEWKLWKKDQIDEFLLLTN